MLLETMIGHIKYFTFDQNLLKKKNISHLIHINDASQGTEILHMKLTW
jgi:hypothetical protein